MSMHINCPRYGAVGGDERLDDKNTYDTKNATIHRKKRAYKAQKSPNQQQKTTIKTLADHGDDPSVYLNCC